MFNTTRVLNCFNKLVGFRQDNNDIYDELYNTAQAISGKAMAFASGPKTITWTNGNFEDEGFKVGQSITISLSASNNGVKTIAAIAGNVITTTEALVNEASSTTAKIISTGDLQISNSSVYINDLPAVTFEMIEAAMSEDAEPKTYLESVYEASVIELMNKFILKSKQNYESKELLSRQAIVSGVATMTNLINQSAGFKGYFFRPHMSNYMRTQIINLGFQATETQPVLRIFIYETSQREPIKTVDLAITKKYSLQWTEVEDIILAWESETGGTGQNYLVGYYEMDPNNPQAYQLQSQALTVDFVCGCQGEPKGLYGRFIGIQPVEIPNERLNWDEDEETYNIPLVDNVSNYVTNRTAGLTAKINVVCDITNVICQNKTIFTRALQHTFAVKLLYDAFASNRINSISDSKREQYKSFALKYDEVLNGYMPPEGGRYVKGIMDTLTVDFSELDHYCLPCKPGITTANLIR